MRPGFSSNAAFNSLDINSSGQITAFELFRMCEARGYFVTHKECEQVVNKMSKFGDGRVNYVEFSNASRN